MPKQPDTSSAKDRAKAAGTGAQMVSCDQSRCADEILALIDGRSVRFGSIEEKFEVLAREWKAFNIGSSVIDYHHAAYMQIVGIGPRIVPLLLQKLKDGDGDWLLALKYITGAKVTTPEMRGDFDLIRRAWLERMG